MLNIGQNCFGFNSPNSPKFSLTRILYCTVYAMLLQYITIYNVPQAIYERMFTWIVRKINSKVEVQDNYYHHDNNVIGVLDIYGFEIFDNNRLLEFICS